MIEKEWSGQPTSDIRLKAGQEAEKQMAFYLKREFGKDKNIFVFNNIRIIHEDEVAQIDHLILHPYGFALVESKSVSGSVEINEHGEWIRWYNDKPTGMRSPIIQLEMQKEVLISFLDGNAKKILGKILGLVQQGVGRRKFDCIVAISDKTVITRKKEITDVYKADAVAGILRKRIKQHKRDIITGSSVWFNKNELQSITNFLITSDQSKGKLIPQPQVAPKDLVSSKVVTTKANKTSKTPQIKYVKPPFSCPNCKIPFDIRYSRNHYLYCYNCRRCDSLEPQCPQCNSIAELKLVERITTYRCTQDANHNGIFYKNGALWLKDKNKLASEKNEPKNQ